MPQKALLSLVVACAGFASADDGLYASYEVDFTDRDRVSLWGSYSADAAADLGGSWTRANLALSLGVANVFNVDWEGADSPGIPRSVFARVKYSF